MKELFFEKEKELRGFWHDGAELDGLVAIQESIKRATRDLMVRTLKNQAGQNWKVADRLTCRENSLATILLDYFSSSPRNKTEFDEWHHKTCLYIHDVLSEKYEVVHYGKAQKVLNMSLKNLYCTKYGEHEEYFRHCHMPLDSYTLEWAFRNVYPATSPRPTKGNTPSWSNFNYKKAELDETGKYTYPYICDLINSYFIEYRSTYNSTLTTLQAEFVIWKEIQLEMAAEGFYSQLLVNYSESDKNQKSKAFRKKSLHEKLCFVKAFLDSTTP